MSATNLPRLPFAATALLALAAAFLPGGRAAAQSPAQSLPRLKMFQPLQSGPPAPTASHAGHATVAGRHSPAPAAPVPVQVTLTFPNVPEAAFVAVRGADGEVRYFPVKGGQKELASRVIVVHPGERVHIQLPPPNPK